VVDRATGLFELLTAGERVMHVSAPAGSGKTFLLRSWIAAEGLGDRTAWVSVGRGEHDPQAFWLSVLDSLRRTRIGADRVRELTAAPALDGATVVARLLEDLSSLDERLWLVIDDLQELQADQAIRHIGTLLAAAPPELRLVLVTRRDLRLGLHRLRLEGELTEVRGGDLRFTVEESRALMQAAGVRLSDDALESLVATTEGWAAGLRLAALSMARDPDPEHFAGSFSGRERAVAEYLLAEVLERQPQEVTRLLLRTSILDRVNGSLADRLTGCSRSHRILAELEDAGAFVVALDPERTWFRYHHLFADLLALELRRTAPQELPGLHAVAAGWWAERGHPVEAIRHAQVAENWGLAARLLGDNWRSMYLDGRLATRRELLSRFPADIVAADAELAALAASERRSVGSLHEAERYLALAERRRASVPEGRRGRFQVSLALVRLWLARDRNDLDAVAQAAQRLLALADGPEAIEMGIGEEGLRTTALIDLGGAEMWAGQLEAAEHHLEHGLEEARRIGRPLVEIEALSYWAFLNLIRSEAIGEERARRAIELARAHGWEDSASAVATAYLALGAATVWRGQFAEAEGWLDRAELVLGRFAQPTTALMLYALRALLEFGRGRHKEAMTAQRAAEGIERGAHDATHRRAASAGAQAGDAGARRRDRTRAASPRRNGRGRPRCGRDAGRPSRAETRRRRCGGRSGGAGTDPRKGFADREPTVGDTGDAAESEHRRRARRRWRQLTGAGARARACRARRSAASVPASSSAGAARAPRATSDHSCLADLRDLEPALRTHPGSPSGGRRTAPGGTLSERASRAALPADQPLGTGNRGRTVRVAEHDQDTHAQRVRQA
jgi:LuxR family transcriptional regulator, maltose regulon positive regulatory protein